MRSGLRLREDRVRQLAHDEALSRIERIIILVFIGGIAAVDLVGFFVSPNAEPLATILSVATTATFVLYLWWPWTATTLLAVLFGLSFITGTQFTVVFAAAVAVGLVMRIGRTALMLSYVVLFLVAVVIIAYTDGGATVNVGIYLIIAIVSGGIGFALRFGSARGHHLEEQLALQAEQEREAVLAERRWIAGELHDSIAHHLTVVALHVQMLDDAEMSQQSQDAIGAAARKAMADLRFVIELATDDGPRSAGVQTGDLAEAIEEARGEFEDAGHSVRCDGDPRDERLPRVAEIIFARIVRESATNVLKYAGQGEISIRLDVDDDAAELSVSSPLSSEPRRALSSSRTGLNRMAERVLGASGEFSAAEVDGRWRVSARLPIV
ncbi:sensor histidine kinase [Microbacterium sp.]|uniref:sensor histidine kinase n=1 Tax=Microbacterium sp. TaxID=51671 RepID=UPI003F99216F